MPSDPKNPSARTAIYARYSSDSQSEAPIEDQVRVCRQYAELQGFTVVAEYDDAAISGASTLRPGYAQRAARTDRAQQECNIERRNRFHIGGFAAISRRPEPHS